MSTVITGVSAIIVTFNPVIEQLRAVINSLKSQVGLLIIVDNGSKNSEQLLAIGLQSNIRLILLSENRGIAYAQNKGIHSALAAGFSTILFSDQDSIYPKNYVQDMMTVLYNRKGIAAVAPTYIDLHKKEKGIITPDDKVNLDIKTKNLVTVKQAMSSGTLVPICVLQQVGYMNEDLFIDWVDFEWCWRARSRGYLIIVNTDVEISHKIGSGAIRFFGKKINCQSPTRHYYITRNALYLALYSPYLKLGHRFLMLAKVVKYVVFYPIIFKPRQRNLKAVWSAVAHGVTKRLGRRNI